MGGVGLCSKAHKDQLNGTCITLNFHGNLTQKVIEPVKVTSFCNITLGRSDVRMFGCNELISETVPTVLLKLGMKLGGQKG